jgi:hypothetical protein
VTEERLPCFLTFIWEKGERVKNQLIDAAKRRKPKQQHTLLSVDDALTFLLSN